ncbi:MAG: tRNA lysidine(34) synthetase TilS [Bacteroidota bacterium]
MISRFVDFWQTWTAGRSSDRYLLAVSGGLDSMALSHLFLENNLTFGIAHCNFQLRGPEADADAAFVHNFAQSQQLPHYQTKFDTTTLAQQERQSIQECARELRYRWLEKVRQEESYDWIVTAHHLNDSLETLLYNLTKGSGLRGLHGIPPQTGKVIRPLSDVSRSELEAYVTTQSIAYREDASNAQVKYRRNLIRHRVLPVLRTINPGLEDTFRHTLQRLRESEWLYQSAVDQLRSEWLLSTPEGVRIHWQALRRLPARDTLLYEFLREYGFTSPQLRQLSAGGPTQSGRLFYSSTHQLLVDRDYLYVRPLTPVKSQTHSIGADAEEIYLPEGRLHLRRLERAPERFPRDPDRAYLAAKALHFPLQLRRWCAGDYFHPLGMEGHRQKLQDFFSNAKLSRFAKEQVWLLESAGEICWVVGWRSDERFRVTQAQEVVYECTWTPNS